MYIITRHINEYNQEPEWYFVAVYINKPTFKDIKTTLNCSDEVAWRLTRWWWRKNVEYEWYELIEIEEWKLYSLN